MFTLPSQFCMRDLTAITAPVFELSTNPYIKGADEAVRAWFMGLNVYPEEKSKMFLDVGRFDVFAELIFPDAELTHLETCLAFFLWAFSADDLADESDLQSQPDGTLAVMDMSLRMAEDPDASTLDHPYAAMLQDILKRIRATANSGAYSRFIRAFKAWKGGIVQQSHNRSLERLPPVSEFILMRRSTIGGAMVEAMVQYSLDLDLPDYVMEHPVVVGMSNATTDILTWPNDLCSFNARRFASMKEQAAGDYQNLVCCVMVERNIELQSAVDVVIDMISDRVKQYLELKNRLPSFGPAVDRELARYIKAMEQAVQGTIVWYYMSPRYFRDMDVSKKNHLVISLYQRGSS